MKPSFAIMVAAIFGVAGPAAANPPDLKTPAPVIYLADNLDEVDRLGWCIDTLGRGFAESLQAHSCKPQGGDVQFRLETESGFVRSVAFPDYCMEYVPEADPVFALTLCQDQNARQQFQYDAAEQTLSPSDDETLCVSVAEDSRQAGPFMSRSLLMTPCATTDPALREWVVKES